MSQVLVSQAPDCVEQDRVMLAEGDIAYTYLERLLPIPIDQETAGWVKHLLLSETLQAAAVGFMEKVEKHKRGAGYIAFLGVVAGMHLATGLFGTDIQFRKAVASDMRELARRYCGQHAGTQSGSTEAGGSRHGEEAR